MRGLPALSILIGLDFSDLKGPLAHIQHVSINEPDEKIERMVARAAGKSADEMWIGTAREKFAVR